MFHLFIVHYWLGSIAQIFSRVSKKYHRSNPSLVCAAIQPSAQISDGFLVIGSTTPKELLLADILIRG